MPKSEKAKKYQDLLKTDADISSILNSLLGEVNNISESSDLDEILSVIGKKLSSVNIATLVLVWDRKKSRVYLRHITLPGEADNIFDKYYNKDDFYISDQDPSGYRDLIASKKSAFIFRRDRDFKRIFSGAQGFYHNIPEVNSLVCPLVLKNTLIGFLEFVAKDFSKKHLKLFSDFSGSLIDNIAMNLFYQEAKASERRLQELWEHAPIAYHTLDKKGVITDINQTEANMLGYSKKEMIGRPIFDFIDPGQQSQARARFRKKISENQLPPKIFSRRYLKKNGQPIYVDIDDVVERDSAGRAIGVRSTMVDVTERVEAEISLRKSESKYHKIFDQIPVSIIELDLSLVKSALDRLKSRNITDIRSYLLRKPDYVIKLLKSSKIKDLNSRCLKRFGARSKNEFVNSLHKVFMEERLESFVDLLTAIYKGKRNFKKESVIRKIRGGRENILVSIDLPRKRTDFSSIMAGVMDITKRKQAEEAVRASEAKYRTLINNALDAVIILDIEGNVTFANEAFCQITGFSSQEILNLNLRRFVHPDSLFETLSRFELRLALGSVENKSHIIKVLSKSGEVLHVEYTATVLRSGEDVVGVQVIARDITDKIVLQQNIEKAKKHYKQVIDTIQEGICVVDRECRIVSLNETFAENIGMAAKEARGVFFPQVIARGKGRGYFGLACTSCGNSMCGVARALRTGKPQMTEGQYEKEPGKILYYQIRFFPAKDDGGEISQVVVVIQDITEKKLNELEIARLNEFNQRIFDASPVSIIVMNQDGRIVAANWLARSLMEKPTDELIGSKLLETPEIKGTPELYEQYQKLLSRGRPLYFHNLQYIEEKTGQERFMNLIAVPLTGPDQQVEGAISMALDNTRSVLANRKMDKLNEELEGKVTKRTWQLDKANRRLRKVLELKSKFLTDASHELRTPLTVIQGNLDLAVQECRLRKRKEPEIFSIIKKEVEYMSGILSDLTMLTNADDGEERLRLEQVKLPEIVATVTQSLSVLAKQKGIRLRSCQKGSGPWVIKGDETKLEKMLSNMVRNGINYTSAGGRVDITLEKIKEGFNLRVKDTGVGIARQEFSNIFERFYRVDKARSRADGGTGLGLSICKWIAEAHGGRIEVESEIGKGSEFTVFLPSREYLEKNQTLFA